jgi:anti-sigma regulatory factor (Ser/Thr protein kinase)
MLASRHINGASPVRKPNLAHRGIGLDRVLARRFRADSHAPGRARSALGALSGSLEERTAEDVRLLVSELVTNSLRHTGSSEIELEVWRSPGTVRVVVSDRGAGFDLPDQPEPGQASGWGLFMVDRLANRWGVDSNDATSVWFELDRDGLALRSA